MQPVSEPERVFGPQLPTVDEAIAAAAAAWEAAWDEFPRNTTQRVFDDWAALDRLCHWVVSRYG